MTERTGLYRLFNENRDLLYIGISANPSARWQTHSHSKDWYPEVVSTTIEWLESRDLAEDAERRAIFAEQPKYNTAWKDREFQRTPVTLNSFIRIHLGELLTQRGMSINGLSEQIGIDRTNLSKFKNGHLSAFRLTTLAAICGALDCQVGDLLSVDLEGYRKFKAEQEEKGGTTTTT